ncbi:hypothetical protein EJC51_46285 [Streptomyces aquilus]|uniref:Transposase n=1 Tax=Streptomyces aquilus TaxID=2548456 RepID=A0A3Q9C6E4_9ACTN|nr:hypothetical protein [Streptomyces aquilus]AZP22807.1 hypothetical protein EJC51_46285 [Streptomyces aquilus]
MTDEPKEENLRRLRQENTDLRRTLALYEEAIRQLTLENHALRGGSSVIPLPTRSRTSHHHSPDLGPVLVAHRARTGVTAEMWRRDPGTPDRADAR